MLKIEWSEYYELNDINIKAKVQEKSGVYRMAEPITDGKVQPFYVGQAEELCTRLLQHISGAEQNSCIKKTIREKKCYFRFAYVPKAEERNSIERALYDHFDKPKCNAIVPPGTAIDVNFE